MGTVWYHVFTHGRYYPAGGMGDYIGSFPSIEEARAAAKAKGSDDYEIAVMNPETGQLEYVEHD